MYLCWSMLVRCFVKVIQELNLISSRWALCFPELPEVGDSDSGIWEILRLKYSLANGEIELPSTNLLLNSTSLSEEWHSVFTSAISRCHWGHQSIDCDRQDLPQAPATTACRATEAVDQWAWYAEYFVGPRNVNFQWIIILATHATPRRRTWVEEYYCYEKRTLNIKF